MTPEQPSPDLALAIGITVVFLALAAVILIACHLLDARARRAEAAAAEETDRIIDDALGHDPGDAIPIILARIEHDLRRRP